MEAPFTITLSPSSSFSSFTSFFTTMKYSVPPATTEVIPSRSASIVICVPSFVTFAIAASPTVPRLPSAMVKVFVSPMRRSTISYCCESVIFTNNCAVFVPSVSVTYPRARSSVTALLVMVSFCPSRLTFKSVASLDTAVRTASFSVSKTFNVTEASDFISILPVVFPSASSHQILLITASSAISEIGILV